MQGRFAYHVAVARRFSEVTGSDSAEDGPRSIHERLPGLFLLMKQARGGGDARRCSGGTGYIQDVIVCHIGQSARSRCRRAEFVSQAPISESRQGPLPVDWSLSALEDRNPWRAGVPCRQRSSEAGRGVPWALKQAESSMRHMAQAKRMALSRLRETRETKRAARLPVFLLFAFLALACLWLWAWKTAPTAFVSAEASDLWPRASNGAKDRQRKRSSAPAQRCSLDPGLHRHKPESPSSSASSPPHTKYRVGTCMIMAALIPLRHRFQVPRQRYRAARGPWPV